jgi:hypothetical protein
MIEVRYGFHLFPMTLMSQIAVWGLTEKKQIDSDCVRLLLLPVFDKYDLKNDKKGRSKGMALQPQPVPERVQKSARPSIDRLQGSGPLAGRQCTLQRRTLRHEDRR